MERQKAVVQIQSAVRGHNTRASARALGRARDAEGEEDAAAVIQAASRGHRERRRHAEAEADDAAAAVQSAYRGHAERVKAAAAPAVEGPPVVPVAPAAEAPAAPPPAEAAETPPAPAEAEVPPAATAGEEALDEAALYVQSAFRGNAERRRQQERDEAALIIQSSFRGRTERQNHQQPAEAVPADTAAAPPPPPEPVPASGSLVAEEDMDEAVAIIQSSFRARAERQHSEQQPAPPAPQAPVATVNSEAGGSDEDLDEATAVISSAFRGRNERRDSDLEEEAASVIQSAYRGKRDRSAQNTSEQQEPQQGKQPTLAFGTAGTLQTVDSSALLIQSVYRGFTERQRLRAVKEKESEKEAVAAVKIQSVFRGHRQRVRNEDEIDDAAVVIQSSFRGYNDRCRTAAEPQPQPQPQPEPEPQPEPQPQPSEYRSADNVDAACLAIQSALRGHMARNSSQWCAAVQSQDEVDCAAEAIQAAFHGFAERRDERAATQIQSAYRGHLVRKNQGDGEAASPAAAGGSNDKEVRRQVEERLGIKDTDSQIAEVQVSFWKSLGRPSPAEREKQDELAAEFGKLNEPPKRHRRKSHAKSAADAKSGKTSKSKKKPQQLYQFANKPRPARNTTRLSGTIKPAVIDFDSPFSTIQVLRPDVRSPRYHKNASYKRWCDKLQVKDGEQLRGLRQRSDKEFQYYVSEYS
eukprot:TRINITY_DN23_c0_g6_i1.p1 TRINITY_DN23_c0_g6~~TRINITY_DN23_c0_g6_i1.p1  ORF type:complete len:694 (-),score=175.61 TRINITY_DN23_c0_g6_i1:92-2173(-)